MSADYRNKIIFIHPSAVVSLFQKFYTSDAVFNIYCIAVRHYTSLQSFL